MVDQQKDYLLFGIGNPLLDISVDTPTDDLLKKYELIPSQAILAGEKQMPIYDELWTIEGVEKIPGGSALNTMRSAAWMLKQTHPGKVAYHGSIGKDEIADVLVQEAENSGLQGFYSVDEESKTGTCAVVVHQKERALCANLSAALKYKTQHLKDHMANLEAAKILYTTCFFITSNFEALIEVGKYALSSNKPLALNLSACFLIQFEGDKVREALTYADYLFCNEDEVDCFAQHNNIEHQSRKDIAVAIAKWQKLNEQRPRIVVVTQGALPVIVAQTQLGSEEVDVQEYPVPVLTNEQLVDTNGAGDSFTGGFLAQLAQDRDIETAVKCGIYLSGQVIQRSGCTFPAENTFAA